MKGRIAVQRCIAEQLRVISYASRHDVLSVVVGSSKAETLIGRVRHLLHETLPQRDDWDRADLRAAYSGNESRLMSRIGGCDNQPIR